MIVVDTNILCYLFLDSERTAQAEQALARDAEWAAPPLWRIELRNVLAGQVRRGGLGLADARRIAEEAEGLMAGGEYHADSGTVLALAADSGCSAYDCEFVAVARSLGAPLVTVDRQVLVAFPDLAVPLAEYADS
ncbi:MAG TPA: type II toxin-antitoxin system VapC family toxin [Thermoanaerobaculia bacterium]|nr:type II toxin-antitoxin system VapC family toxin [Thermoanaerobaculia bacterium]